MRLVGHGYHCFLDMAVALTFRVVCVLTPLLPSVQQSQIDMELLHESIELNGIGFIRNEYGDTLSSFLFQLSSS